MNQIIILDTGPLGMICSPKASANNTKLKSWLENQLRRNAIVALPEIADYELRRELLLNDRIKSIALLDAFCSSFEFLPFTREIILRAAQLWAEVRKTGLPTADRKNIDGDVLLAASALHAPYYLEIPTANATIITSNTKHLSRFVRAISWQSIV